MNQRIRELARQAGAHVSTRNLMSNPPQHIETVELWDDRIEKFAELIIRKCAFIVEDAVDHREPASTYVDKIKQHFGVE